MYPAHQLVGPNFSPGASCLSGMLMPSALAQETVLPHQVSMTPAPMVPFRGNWRAKKMITAEIATPESRAADRTSTMEVDDVSRRTFEGGDERERTVVLRPPAEMTAAHNELEDECYDGPGYVVHCRRGRDRACALEDEREVEVADRRVGPPSRDDPSK